MKSITIILLHFFLINSLFASDSLNLNLENVTFYTNLEKDQFTKIINNKKYDKLACALAIDTMISTQNMSSYSSKLDKMFFELDNQKIKDKPLEKAVKIIHAYVEENFFKKYELISDLPNTLNNGVYNCVSGTILYAIIFDHYNYEYEIKEVPSHVYIMLEPKTNAILIESTDPKVGYQVFNTNEINKILTKLKENKIISSDDIQNKDKGEILSEFINDDKTIDFSKLVSFQYSNRALQANDAIKYSLAKSFCERAYLLYPSESNEKMYIYFSLLEYDECKDEGDKIKLLFDINKIYKGINNDFLSSNFKLYTYDLLIKNNKFDMYMSYTNKFLPISYDSTLNINLMSYHYSILGYYYASLNQHQRAIEYYRKARIYEPNNIELKSNIQISFINMTSDFYDSDILDDFDEQKMDSVMYSIFSLIDSNIFLLENNKIKTFYYENKEKSLTYITPNEFMSSNDMDSKLLVDNKIILIKNQFPKDTLHSNKLIGSLYHDISLNFFKQKRYDKTREYLLLAIKRDPTNIMYKKRYEDMKGYK